MPDPEIPVQSGLQKNSSQVVKQPGRERQAHSRQVSAARNCQFLRQSTTRLLYGPGLIKSSGNQLHVRMGVYEHISSTPAKLHTDFKKWLCNDNVHYTNLPRGPRSG